MSRFCVDCPVQCSTDRTLHKGYCGVNDTFRVARASLHFWEEPCISGNHGSGTVFFSGCSLKCVYCQNYEISHGIFGKDITPNRLVKIFNRLIEEGANNINLVNPTHYTYQLQKLLQKEKPCVPVVYNTGGYDKVESLKKFDGLADIYLADLKYIDSNISKKYSNAENYFDFASKALFEMKRQQPDDIFDSNGIMQKGIIIRHLVLPGNISQSIKVLDFIKEAFGNNVIVSLMSQYTPCGDAKSYPTINRRLSKREYTTVLNHLNKLGFENGYIQELSSAKEEYVPPFDLTGI